ncbi:MAG: hypothetical protein M1825_002738 [Sarcosagium campestre]|nr:MAG: hypothetical protein M1825_002738 [Sarcosagium campestre]
MEPPPAPLQRKSSFSQESEDSQTATEFINDQLQLEADAREALPYAFDTCTQQLGPLRQILFSCLTCNPPPASLSDPYSPAGLCYSCSISCHGDHELVELFNKRNFVCDCGTTRLPSSARCTLRINPKTGSKGGSHSEPAVETNTYNKNFRNRFCGCEQEYDVNNEKGTMYQCLGLGTEADGGCGEDWWHPECLVGISRDWNKKASNLQKAAAKFEKNPDSEQDRQPTNGVPLQSENNDLLAENVEVDDPPAPPGFPDEDAFSAFICWKCVDAFPWIKRYAGSTGFLTPVLHRTSIPSGNRSLDSPLIGLEAVGHESGRDSLDSEPTSKKRKAEDDIDSHGAQASLKKVKSEVEITKSEIQTPKECNYEKLPEAPTESFSLFLTEEFRENFCRCKNCFPKLGKHSQLLEEEESYEPPLSESGDEDGQGGSSVGTGSLLDRGERALSNVDRVRAIEGVMVYNHLKDKVKTFLKPFAENGQAVGAEDIKKYFEQLRGDAEAVRLAGAAAAGGRGGSGEDGDGRKEQSGY